MSEKWPGIIQEPLVVEPLLKTDYLQRPVKVYGVMDANERIICECKFAPDAYFLAAQITRALKHEAKRQKGLVYRFHSRYVAPFIAWLRYR